jgi:hypothetical protein
MSRLRAQTAVALSAAALAVAVAPGCAHNDQSFFIDHVISPPIRAEGANCTFDGARTSPALFSGSVDVGIAKSYQAVVTVVNQLLPKAKADELRLETARIQISGATVRVTQADGTLLDEYTNLTTGTVDPQLGSAAVEVVAISPLVMDAFRGKVAAGARDSLKKLKLCDRSASQIVTANIKVFGRTLGGQDIESNEFTYPISVCRGCLVDFTCAAGVRARCDGLPVSTDERCKSVPCYIGQDRSTACQLCGSDDACDFSKSSFCN